MEIPHLTAAQRHYLEGCLESAQRVHEPRLRCPSDGGHTTESYALSHALRELDSRGASRIAAPPRPVRR